jgi:hypothetical protein
MSLTKEKLQEMGYALGADLAHEYCLNPRTVSDVLARARVQRVDATGIDGRAKLVFYHSQSAGLALSEYLAKKRAQIEAVGVAAYAKLRSEIGGPFSEPQQKSLPMMPEITDYSASDFKSLDDRVSKFEKMMEILLSSPLRDHSANDRIGALEKQVAALEKQVAAIVAAVPFHLRPVVSAPEHVHD